MQCIIRCMIVHEWNVRAFFWILFFLFFLRFNECEMQMSYANAMMRMSLWCMLWCECILVGMQWMQMSPWEYVMMLMYPCGYVMAWMSSWCMLWCECTLVGMQWMQMSPWEYVMMLMYPCGYAMAWMSSCRYAMNANAPLWVYHDTNSLMQT